MTVIDRRQHARTAASRRSVVVAALTAVLLAAAAVAVSAPVAAATAGRSAASPPPPSGLDYRYVYIDTPNGHGRALAVSDDRTVVGYEIVNITTEQPFVFTEQGGTTTLPIDSGMHSGGAMAISPNAGFVAGWEETTAGDCWVVRWSKDTTGAWTVRQLVHHDANDPNQVGCAYDPVGVGDDGSVAITTGSTTTSSGLLWTEQGVTTLAGQPRAMASDGTIAGSTADGSVGTRPWTDTGGALSAPPGTTRSEADGVGADGTLAVNSDTGAFQRRPDGTYLPLRDLPATGTAPASRAWSVSDHAEVVGDSDVAVLAGGGTLPHAVRWNSDGTVTDLNDVTGHQENETLLTARAVDKDGDIVGGATSDRSSGLEAPMLLVALPPVIFVPGVAGSHLVDGSGSEQWINCIGDHGGLALPPDGSTDIYADDVLRYDDCGPFHTPDTDAYGPFIDALEQQGLVEYQEAKDPSRWTTAGCDTSQRSQHPNLFLFPYDWRQSNAESALHLADLMGCVRRFYTGPVLLVAHSMGGLVARRYILDHPDDSHHVRDLLTVGTPWLGAPKLVRAVETGDFIPHLMTQDTVKTIIPTMPGPGQLLPSADWYQVADAPFREVGWDINADGKQFETYSRDQLDALLDSQHANHAAITASANAFHGLTTAEGSQDDWRTDSTDVRYTVMYGVHSHTDTPGPVRAVGNVSCRVSGDSYDCTKTNSFQIGLVDGDGTVPLESSTRQGNGVDLNNQDHETLIPVPGSVWGDDTTEHTGLTRNPFVQRQVLVTDGRVPADSASGTRAASRATAGATSAAGAAATGASQWMVDVHGVDGTTTVQAPDGTTDALAGPDLRPSLPGVSHDIEGAGAELDVLPDDGTYAVTFRAGSDPLQVDVRRGTQASPSQRSIWSDASVPAGHVATVTLGATSVSLRYDSDGDGTVDTTVDPTFTPGGSQLADVTAPTMAVGAIRLQGTLQYTIDATDDASGVGRVLWSVDGTHFQRYQGPIALDPATTRLSAFAEDRAGNRSGLQTFDLQGVEPAPVTTLTLDPAPGANGWITSGPVTAHLHVQASDGTSITSLLYGPPSTTVAGTDATVALPNVPTFLVFRAEDSSGAVEPLHVVPLPIDTVPPTVTMALADGTSRAALGTIAGQSKDGQSGVAHTRVAIVRNSDGDSWNGTSWQSAPADLATAPGPQPWNGDWVLSSGLPTGADLPAGAYTVRATATDVAGLVSHPATAVVTITTTPELRSLEAPTGGSLAGHVTFAHAINASGQVAGNVTDYVDYETWATRWDADGTPHLLAGAYPAADAFAVNRTGVVVGKAPMQPALWRPDGTQVLLQPGPSGPYSSPVSAMAVNDTGVAAGAGLGGRGNSWGIWNGSTAYTPLAQPDLGTDTASIAALVHGIDDAGDVVGSMTRHLANGVSYPAAITATTSSASYLFPNVNGDRPAISSADGVDPSGRIVGWAIVDTPDGTPFLRNLDGSTTWFDLSGIGQQCGTATGINAGDVVVGYGGQCGWLTDLAMADSQAWVIRDGKAQTLDSMLPADSGWNLEQAYGINDAGQIVGVGTHDGHQRGFVFSLGALPDLDRAPTATDQHAATPKGTPLDVALSGTDPDGDPLTWTAVDQPGHGSLSPVAGSSITYTPTPGFVGTDTFTVRASDGTYRSNTATVTVTVGSQAERPPVALILAPTSAVESTAVPLDGGGSFSPAGGPLTYDWDLNGDGVYGDATTPTAAARPTGAGPLEVGLRVTDPNGTATATATITVLHAPPVVGGPADASIGVGDTYTATGTWAEPGTEAITSATVDYGDGDGPRPLDVTGGSFRLGHRYDATGAYAVRVEVCNGAHSCGSADAIVLVQAATDSVVIRADGTDASSVEGQAADLTVAGFTITGAGPDTVKATIDWGDGGSPGPGSVQSGSTGSTVGGAHNYADEGSYGVTVTLTSGTTTVTTHSTVEVGDAPLTAGPTTDLVTRPDASGLVVGTFTDANAEAPAADFSATIDWGDGTTTPGTVAASGASGFSVAGSHRYATLGERTVAATVHDAGGSSVTIRRSLWVYDLPSGGVFVLGDGSTGIGAHVTFWSGRWATSNSLSGGAAPASFAGFVPGTPPAVGSRWTAPPGASGHPPTSLPSVMAVAVTDSVAKHGSALAGTVQGYVLVQVDPGYRPDAGHPGTGTVVAAGPATP